MRALYPLLLFAVVFLGSCKKDNSLEESIPVIVKQEGVLRVECANCVVNYKIDFKKYSVKIDKGSNDIAFYYSSNFNLVAEVVSKEEQKIRVLVIDAFGRVVSNQLKNWNEGESSLQTFVINIK